MTNTYLFLEDKFFYMPDYKISFSASGETQKGTGRETNEDNFLIGSYYKKNCRAVNDTFCFTAPNRCRYSLFAVFDGMGGGPYGEYASLCAAEEFYNIHMKLNDMLSPKQVSCMVSDAFQTANNRIIRSSYNMLGTTAVVCVLDRQGEKIKFLWSGDSRGYLYRDHLLFQITEDQSKAALCVKKGIYSKTDPQYKADQNKLTGFVGMDAYGYSFHPLETAWLPLKQEDMIFLMTDGISSICNNNEIQSIVRGCVDDAIVTSLICTARRSGSQDDLSAVQVKLYSNKHEE